MRRGGTRRRLPSAVRGTEGPPTWPTRVDEAGPTGSPGPGFLGSVKRVVDGRATPVGVTRRRERGRIAGRWGVRVRSTPRGIHPGSGWRDAAGAARRGPCVRVTHSLRCPTGTAECRRASRVSDKTWPLARPRLRRPRRGCRGRRSVGRVWRSTISRAGGQPAEGSEHLGQVNGDGAAIADAGRSARPHGSCPASSGGPVTMAVAQPTTTRDRSDRRVSEGIFSRSVGENEPENAREPTSELPKSGGQERKGRRSDGREAFECGLCLGLLFSSQRRAMARGSHPARRPAGDSLQLATQ